MDRLTDGQTDKHRETEKTETERELTISRSFKVNCVCYPNFNWMIIIVQFIPQKWKLSTWRERERESKRERERYEVSE